MAKLERLAPIVAICAVLGCASSTSPPPQDPSGPPPEPPSSESAPDMPADSTSTNAPPSGGGDTSSGGAADAKWEGEDKAAGKPVERTAAETRTTEVIQKIVLDNRQSVRDCYDRGRKDLPDLKGKLTIKFVLDPEGKVKTAELDMAGSDIKAPAVTSCAIEAIRKMKFPPSSRGMDTTVNYPFDFKPDGGGRPKK
jgi:TonB family protein